MANPITDTIQTSTPVVTGDSAIDSALNYVDTLVSKINISPNITNPTIDLSNSPYVKYAIYGIILIAIYFLFISKKTKIT